MKHDNIEDIAKHVPMQSMKIDPKISGIDTATRDRLNRFSQSFEDLCEYIKKLEKRIIDLENTQEQ